MNKKMITVLLAAFFLTATPAVSNAGRGYYHGGHYRGHGGDIWAGLGIGLFTGVILSAILNPPPSRAVVYESPAPVVVQPGPVVVREYGTQPLVPASGAVSVNIGALNVRSGPSLGQPVVAQVRYGDVLTVLKSSPGWLNVSTPTGAVGWVMSRYITTPVG